MKIQVCIFDRNNLDVIFCFQCMMYHCDDFIMYINVEPLCCPPETNIICKLYFNLKKSTCYMLLVCSNISDTCQIMAYVTVIFLSVINKYFWGRYSRLCSLWNYHLLILPSIDDFLTPSFLLYVLVGILLEKELSSFYFTYSFSHIITDS